jgi:hypothetical protein
MTSIILLGLAILAGAFFRTPEGIGPAGSGRLSGWQKLLGVVAFVLALLIVLNPEFLALGLVGDAAFFDALVLLLSLQLQIYLARAWHRVRPVCSKMMWLPIARLSWNFSAIVLIFAPIGDVVSSIQKAVHRIFS